MWFLSREATFYNGHILKTFGKKKLALQSTAENRIFEKRNNDRIECFLSLSLSLARLR